MLPGALSHAVAHLFDIDPRQAMHEDLVQLKSLLEEGETLERDYDGASVSSRIHIKVNGTPEKLGRSIFQRAGKQYHPFQYPVETTIELRSASPVAVY